MKDTDNACQCFYGKLDAASELKCQVCGTSVFSRKNVPAEECGGTDMEVAVCMMCGTIHYITRDGSGRTTIEIEQDEIEQFIREHSVAKSAPGDDGHRFSCEDCGGENFSIVKIVTDNEGSEEKLVMQCAYCCSLYSADIEDLAGMSEIFS